MDKTITIRKVVVTDVDTVPQNISPIKRYGILVIVGDQFFKHWFIELSEDYLGTVDALNVINIINNSGHFDLMKEILEVKQYAFQDRVVYIEHIKNPTHVVTFNCQQYSVRLEP